MKTILLKNIFCLSLSVFLFSSFHTLFSQDEKGARSRDFHHDLFSSLAASETRKRQDLAIPYLIQVTMSLAKSGGPKTWRSRDLDLLRDRSAQALNSYDRLKAQAGTSDRLLSHEALSETLRKTGDLVTRIPVTKRGHAALLWGGVEAVKILDAELQAMIAPAIQASAAQNLGSIDKSVGDLKNVYRDFMVFREENPAAAKVIEEMIHRRIGVNPNSSTDELLEDFPDRKISLAIEDLSNALMKDREISDEQMRNLSQSFMSALDSLGKRLDEQLEFEQQNQEKIALEEKEFEEKQKLEKANYDQMQNFEAGLKVASSLTEWIKDPEMKAAARKVVGAGQFAFQLHRASVNIEKLPNFANLANVVTAASELFRLFMNQLSEFSMLAEQLNALQDQIQSMNESINHRFDLLQDFLEESLRISLQAMDEIRKQNFNLKEQILSLETLTKAIEGDIRALSLQSHEEFKAVTNELLRQNSVCFPDSILRKSLTEEKIKDCLDLFFGMATRLSRDQVATRLPIDFLDYMNNKSESFFDFFPQLQLSHLNQELRGLSFSSMINHLAFAAQNYIGSGIWPNQESSSANPRFSDELIRLGSMQFGSRIENPPFASPGTWAASMELLFMFLKRYPEAEKHWSKEQRELLMTPGLEVQSWIAHLRSPRFFDLLMTELELKSHAFLSELEKFQSQIIANSGVQDAGLNLWEKPSFDSLIQTPVPVPSVAQNTQGGLWPIAIHPHSLHPVVNSSPILRKLYQLRKGTWDSDLKILYYLEGQKEAGHGLHWHNFHREQEGSADLARGTKGGANGQKRIVRWGRNVAQIRAIVYAEFHGKTVAVCNHNSVNLWIGNFNTQRRLDKQDEITQDILTLFQTYWDQVSGQPKMWDHFSCQPIDHSFLIELGTNHWMSNQAHLKSGMRQAFLNESEFAGFGNNSGLIQKANEFRALLSLARNLQAYAFASRLDYSDALRVGLFGGGLSRLNYKHKKLSGLSTLNYEQTLGLSSQFLGWEDLALVFEESFDRPEVSNKILNLQTITQENLNKWKKLIETERKQLKDDQFYPAIDYWTERLSAGKR